MGVDSALIHRDPGRLKCRFLSSEFLPILCRGFYRGDGHRSISKSMMYFCAAVDSQLSTGNRLCIWIVGVENVPFCSACRQGIDCASVNAALGEQVTNLLDIGITQLRETLLSSLL